MFHAFKGSLQVCHLGAKDAVYFPCRYLRRMIVAWMAQNRCYVLKHKLTSLQSKYGIEGGDLVPNPISYREYLRMMLRRTTWGEDVVTAWPPCLTSGLQLSTLQPWRSTGIGTTWLCTELVWSLSTMAGIITYMLVSGR